MGSFVKSGHGKQRPIDDNFGINEPSVLRQVYLRGVGVQRLGSRYGNRKNGKTTYKFANQW